MPLLKQPDMTCDIRFPRGYLLQWVYFVRSQVARVAFFLFRKTLTCHRRYLPHLLGSLFYDGGFPGEDGWKNTILRWESHEIEVLCSSGACITLEVWWSSCTAQFFVHFDLTFRLGHNILSISPRESVLQLLIQTLRLFILANRGFILFFSARQLIHYKTFRTSILSRR